LSEADQRPVAFAVRPMVKVPTGDETVGASTGKADFLVDAILSKELQRVVEVSGFAGFEFRGQPDGFEIPNRVFRWGAGAGFPSRGPLRAVTELSGYVNNRDTVTITGTPFTTVDG